MTMCHLGIKKMCIINVVMLSCNACIYSSLNYIKDINQAYKISRYRSDRHGGGIYYARR